MRPARYRRLLDHHHRQRLARLGQERLRRQRPELRLPHQEPVEGHPPLREPPDLREALRLGPQLHHRHHRHEEAPCKSRMDRVLVARHVHRHLRHAHRRLPVRSA